MKTASEVKNSSRTRTLAHETRKNKRWLSMLVIVALVVSAAFTSCGGGSGSGSGTGKSSGKITMTTEQGGNFCIRLSGSGVATVDWGDGSEKVSLTLDEYRVNFQHVYPSATIRTITINGENITGLVIDNNFITNLDVSRCTELTKLMFFGPITSLDLSKNTALTDLMFQQVELTTAALNDLFKSLHSNAVEKRINFISYSPGAQHDCDISILERKGWVIWH